MQYVPNVSKFLGVRKMNNRIQFGQHMGNTMDSVSVYCEIGRLNGSDGCDWVSVCVYVRQILTK